MQIENYVMSNSGALSVEVDTIINPYTVGVNSPTLTLVQAIDFIGLEVGLKDIERMSNEAETLATFGLVDKIDIASISPLVDATSKYLAAPAGTKLVTKTYDFTVSESDREDIIAATTATTYCLRIRTVMIDESLPSSPAVPNDIVEFNNLVKSLGSPESTIGSHSSYYGCISIPVNVVAGRFLFVDIASRVISPLKPTATPEHLVVSPVLNTWDQLPPVVIDRDTGMISLATILKINREDEVALNGNDLRVWIYAYVTPYVEGSTYRDDSYNLPPTMFSTTLIVHKVSDFWSVPGKRINYSNVYIGSNNTWQIFNFDLPMPTLMSEIASMRGSGSTDTKYVVAVFTIVGRDSHNPPVPWPTTPTEYEMFFNNANYDYRNTTYLSLEVPMPTIPEPEPTPEETFTLDKPYYYEYGSTANPTVVISGTASGPISVADLSISVLDGNYVDKPLTIHSVDKVGDKWTAVVSDPNVKKVIPGLMHKAYSATDSTTNLFTKLETTFKYTNPTSGKVWEIYTNDINVHCPTQTRAVNLDSPRTTHEVINSFRSVYPSEVGHTGWWSDLPYGRLDLDTGVLSVDVIVKLVKPEEIALNGNGLKLWVRTQMDLDSNLTNLAFFDTKKLVTDNIFTLNKSLAVIDNLGDIWNDPTKVQSYISRFPDAPVEAKDWKIVKVDIPLGSNFKTDTNAARTALGFEPLPTTDLLLTIHTFIGRTDMSRTPPYPDTIEAFNKTFIDSLTKYPYNLSSDNSLVMRSHLKIDLPV